MEGQHTTPLGTAPGARHLSTGTVQQLRTVLTKRVPAVTPSAQHAPTPEPVTPPRGVMYPFIPYPIELVEMERKGTMRPAHIRILALRRFADPQTGQFITSTKEVAELTGSDRSTAQKGLRAMEKAHFLHLRHARSRTTTLLITFGGFPQPLYGDDGKPPLRWDLSGTAYVPGVAQSPAQCQPPRHTPAQEHHGLGKPQNALSTPPVGTGGSYNETDTEHRDRSSFSVSLLGSGKLKSVDDFSPQSHDESMIHDLAKRLGEPYMNSFLALRRKYGLARLQRACGLAQDKRDDVYYPLRQSPGAYVRWLLQNGKC